jgi:hypothetical protein
LNGAERDIQPAGTEGESLAASPNSDLAPAVDRTPMTVVATIRP